MAVVDYGSIVKGGLNAFNEVDQYIKAEEQREYQNAKDRRDHLYKSDRDKMSDFWRDYQQQYKEYRDNVEDDRNERQLAHKIKIDNENIALNQQKHALNVAQLEETKKQNEHNRQNDIVKNEIAAARLNELIIKGVNGNSKIGLKGGTKSFAKATPEQLKYVDAIYENHDTPEQKKILVQQLYDSIPDEEQRLAVANYFEFKSGLENTTTLQGMRNVSEAFNTVVTEAVKDGKTPTGEQIAQDFAEYVNTNNQLDLQHAIGSAVEQITVGATVKDTVNGKEVILGEIGGVDLNSLRLFPIQDTATVGVAGTFFVNGKPVPMVVPNINGEALAFDESTIKNMKTHTLKAQVNSIVQNRNKNKPLTEKQYKDTHGSGSFNPEEYETYLEKSKLEQAIPIQRYNKDLDVVTLKDAKAQAWEIDKAVEQSQEKPGTSATSNIYENRYNGKRVGNKVLIDGGKIEVPITEEEDQILKSYKEQADKILSQQFNEDDIAKVQQTYNLSRPHAIKYLQDKASQESFNKRYAPMLKKMTTVDVIEKGFQGDFSDNTFDILTRDLKGDYVFVNEKTNDVISVDEYDKLPKEEKDKYEKTNIRDDEDRLNVALMQNVPNEDYRKTFITQYKEFKEERNKLRTAAGGDKGAYLRKFLETKKSVGDKSLPKEKIEEMYRITERYKNLPLNDDDGKANKEKLLSELKDAGLNGTTMYRVIALLKTDEGKSVNSFREKKYSYTKAIEPKKKPQKLSDATSKVFNANNGLGGYGYANTSLGGIIKEKKFDGPFDRVYSAIDNLKGLNDLNQ